MFEKIKKFITKTAINAINAQCSEEEAIYRGMGLGIVEFAVDNDLVDELEAKYLMVYLEETQKLIEIEKLSQ